MGTQTPQPGGDRSAACQSMGASSKTSLLGTQQECGHQIIHHDAANEATKNMTQDAHLKIFCTTSSSMQLDVGIFIPW